MWLNKLFLRNIKPIRKPQAETDQKMLEQAPVDRRKQFPTSDAAVADPLRMPSGFAQSTSAYTSGQMALICWRMPRKSSKVSGRLERSRSNADG